ncbi:hypothetical protein [uncultured Bilophila sp.]|uniref:hypothetical protein n=1 Tax=uncultured Bilophila sp. TaxID=529385 RepID=UPI00280B6395|nr:hypothetical protein [uncultured Bilophila sp.]
MELTVDMSVPGVVEIGATGLRGLAQEIRTALATRKGSVPLDRDFGLSWDVIDLPLPEARPLLVAEIGCGLERCVPRIRVKDVSFKADVPEAADGKLVPVVTVEIRKEYLNDFR